MISITLSTYLCEYVLKHIFCFQDVYRSLKLNIIPKQQFQMVLLTKVKTTVAVLIIQI